MRGRDEDPARWCFHQIRSSILKAGLLSWASVPGYPSEDFFFFFKRIYLFAYGIKRDIFWTVAAAL